MYASAASLALMGLLSSSFWETSPAAAVPVNSAPSAVEVGYTPIIRHLDSKGQLEWTETNGGQVTHFSNTMANKAISNIASEEGWRPSDTSNGDSTTLQKRWSGWTNIGKIAEKSAKYACINSGAWVSDGVVSGAYDKACKEFVSKTPAGLTVDGAWTVYRTIVAGTDGKNKKLNFRYFNHNKDTPLTKAMCDTVYKQLSSNLCQGKGDHGTHSQGGTIRIVDDDFEIGFDPDDHDD